MIVKLARAAAILAGAVTLAFAPQLSASAAYTNQIARIAPPAVIIVLKDTVAHCVTSPDGGDRGCFYGDAQTYGEVIFFTDAIQDGYRGGVHW